MSTKNGKLSIKKEDGVKEEISSVGETPVEERLPEHGDIPDGNSTGNIPLTDARPVLAELTKEMPEVVPEAVNAAKEEAAQAAKDNEGFVDRYGRKFDPALHASTTDGKPIFTRDGNIALKRGAKLGGKQKLNIPSDVKPENQALIESEKMLAAKRLAAARVTAGSFIQITTAVFGDEWKPEKSNGVDEYDYLTQATDEYYATVGFRELPPWMGIAIAYSSYAMKRLNKPVTQSKIKTFIQTVKDRVILWWVNRKNGKGVKPNGTRPNSRDNGNGKDNVSVSVSEGTQR